MPPSFLIYRFALYVTKNKKYAAKRPFTDQATETIITCQGDNCNKALKINKNGFPY